MIRVSVSASEELLEEAAQTARRESSTRAAVLAAWLAEGFHAQRRRALAEAYDAFYGESDPEDVPAKVRRERAARFDQRWE
jgi:sirohydrochlorin ferrochelatase